MKKNRKSKCRTSFSHLSLHLDLFFQKNNQSSSTSHTCQLAQASTHTHPTFVFFIRTPDSSDPPSPPPVRIRMLRQLSADETGPPTFTMRSLLNPFSVTRNCSRPCHTGIRSQESELRGIPLCCNLLGGGTSLLRPGRST